MFGPPLSPMIPATLTCLAIGVGSCLVAALVQVWRLRLIGGRVAAGALRPDVGRRAYRRTQFWLGVLPALGLVIAPLFVLHSATPAVVAIALPVVWWTGIVTYALVVFPLESRRALAALELPSDPHERVGQGMGWLVRFTVLAAVFAASGVLLLAGLGAWLWLLSSLLLLAFVVDRLVAARPARWLAGTEPLAATEWAPLLPRIEAWARLASIPLAGVRVRRTERLGQVAESITPFGPPILALSDAFLGAASWREVDGVVTLLLGQRRAVVGPITQATILCVVTRQWMFLAGVVMLPTLAITPRSPGSVAAPLLWFAIAIICGAAQLAIQRSVDRYSVALTGDPAGLMVALTTLHKLAGTDGRYLPTLQRMRPLDRLLHQPGQHAPWATDPVPSRFTCVVDGWTLTVSPQVAAPQPPVPPGAWLASRDGEAGGSA